MDLLKTALGHRVGEALLLDLVCIGIVAYGVFYRRNRRADLALAYVAINVSLFCVAVLIVNQMRLGVGFGFGLFAILSIIRLRSEPIAPQEGAYYFVALVLGLINGMQFRDVALARVLDIGLVGIMLVLDNRWLTPRAVRQVVVLDRVYPDEATLRADLQARLGGTVKRLFVRQTDYVRETTDVDVRYVPTRSQPAREPDAARLTAPASPVTTP
jgi:hypothetical protein